MKKNQTPLRVIEGGLAQQEPAADQNLKEQAIENPSLENLGVEKQNVSATPQDAQAENTQEQDEAFALRASEQVTVPRLIALRQTLETEPEQDTGESDDSSDTEDASSEPAAKALRPVQKEFPFALIQGEPVTEIPSDLYIPPEALEVFLEAFEGPLDLLLYLIKRQNLDIMEINVAELTEQYMQYVRLMDSMQFELAAEYLVMAAMLAEIKSRMLLPRSQDIDEDDDDPRAQLIRRLQEYERFKKAAEDIDTLPREERDVFVAEVKPPVDDRPKPEPDVNLKELLVALGDVLHRADMLESHHISLEPLSTRERMGNVLDLLADSGSDNFVSFQAFFKPEEGRGGVVVTFLAIMELIKESLIEIVQTEAFGAIHIRSKSHGDEETESFASDEFEEDATQAEHNTAPEDT